MGTPSKDFIESQFNDYYKEYFSRIYRYTYRLTGNNEEAEQLTQQTFASLYGYFLSKSKTINARPLLFRIATNACFNYLSKKKKNEEVLNKMSASDSSQDNPLQETINSQRKELIQKGLAQLKRRDRLCILLYLEGLSYSEISHIIKVNKITVGKVLLRAIERLALQIKKGDRL